MKNLLFSALLALLATACVTDDPETIVVAADEDDGTGGAARDDKSDAVSEFHVVDVALPFDEVADRSFRVFTSRRAFNDTYGVSDTLDVDFRYQWVFVYQAGSQPTGGYIPGLLDITRRNDRIRFWTQLATPGNGCFTSQAESRPYVVVAFRKPSRPSAARFSVLHGEIVNDCEEPVSCAVVLCETQTYCDESTGTAQCLPLVCPPPGTVIDCKIPLTPDRAPRCNPSFQQWVGGHCPDVTFAL